MVRYLPTCVLLHHACTSLSSDRQDTPQGKLSVVCHALQATVALQVAGMVSIFYMHKHSMRAEIQEQKELLSTLHVRSSRVGLVAPGG